MSYLSESQISSLAANVKLLPIEKIEDISRFQFDSKIDEYNDFLSFAKTYKKLNISKTFLLFTSDLSNLIGYLTLSCDAIKLSRKEKRQHGLKSVPFVSMPALKIGKLATNKNLLKSVKGYGSFLIEMARAYAFHINETGAACRFLTVDADLEYDANTLDFYIKNGFIINNREEYIQQKEKYKTISMRLDIFTDHQIQALEDEPAI